MKKNLFDELMSSAQEALEHAKGKRNLRTTVLPSAPKPMSASDVRRLRNKLNASQTVFASWLNVSTKLVQAWESDRRTPEGPALRLLRIAETQPDVVFTWTVSSKNTKPQQNEDVETWSQQSQRRVAAKKSRVFRKAARKAAVKRTTGNSRSIAEGA